MKEGNLMAADWKWTGKKVKTKGMDIYHFPSVRKEERYRNVAVFYTERNVLSMEFFLPTDYEWLDIRRMRNVVGRELADIFKVGKFLYWAEQPSKAKTRKGCEPIGAYAYSAQFCCSTPRPTEDQLKGAYSVMKDGAIEGEECTDYKYKVAGAGATPIRRTTRLIRSRRKKREISS